MKLFYRQFNLFSRSQAPIVAPHFNRLSEGGRFFCNSARAFFPECYIARIGEWSSPWEHEILPGYEIPNLQSKFEKTFNEVTDLRALDIEKIIKQTNKECYLFYSGGIDSTVVLISLIKNFNAQSLKKLRLCMNSESIIENPYFYKKYIENNFQIIDSSENLYSSILKNTNSFCITADSGDFIYGTEIGVKLYPQIRNLVNFLNPKLKKKLNKLYPKIGSSDTHFSEFKDLLIFYFNNSLKQGIKTFENLSHLPKEYRTFTHEDENFGELFYLKIVRNIESCNAPVQSLHDFFWWTMFNPRFLWSVVRPGLNYSLENNLENIINHGVVNWYAGHNYQLWSLNNNNNGEKLYGTTQSSYKWASKKYIWEFDKNDWYRDNKIKMPSLPLLFRLNWKKYFYELDNRFGITNDYNIIRVGNPTIDNFIIEGITNYKIDWC